MDGENAPRLSSCFLDFVFFAIFRSNGLVSKDQTQLLRCEQW